MPRHIVEGDSATGDLTSQYPSPELSATSNVESIIRANRLDQMATPAADLVLNSYKITNLGTPTSSGDAATKSYVDSIASGLSIKTSVALATAAALATNTYSNGSAGVGATLTGTSTGVLTVDGTTVALNDRVLVKNEATAANNGIYYCSTAGAVGVAYVLTRATDMDQASEIAGSFTFVTSGSTNAGAGFVVTGAGPFTVGTTAINWSQFSGGTSYTAGAGLTLAGTVFSANLDTDGTLAANSDNKIATQKATKTYVDASATADASSSVKGKVQLTNDLGGTAASPTVVATHLSSALPVAQGGTGTTASTGTGNVVLSTSPNITTPTGIVKGDVGLGNVTNNAQLTIANNLSDLGSVSTARTNLSVAPYGRTTVNNANYTILTTDRWVSQNGFISAARTFTLPAASAVPAGWEIIIGDESGLVTPTKCVIIARAGSDLIDGQTSYTINEAYGIRKLISNGITKWTVTNTFLNYVSDINLPAPTVDSTRGNKLNGGGIRKVAGIEIANTIDQVKGAVWSQVGATSIGGNIVNIASWSSPSAGVLATDQNLATIGAQSTGRLNITQSGSVIAVVDYTGISGQTFTGCTYVSGSGTLGSGDYIWSQVADANSDRFLGTPLNIVINQIVDYSGGTLGPTPYTGVTDTGAPRGNINVEGSVKFLNGINSILGQAPVFQSAMYYYTTNGSAVAAAEQFVSAPTVWNASTTDVYYPSNPTFNIPGQNQGWDLHYWAAGVHTANYLSSGATMNDIQSAEYFSTLFLGNKTRALRRFAYTAHDTNISGDATIETQIGFAAGKVAADAASFSKWTAATNNIGILNASGTVLTPSTKVVTAGFTLASTDINTSNLTLTSASSVSAATGSAVLATPNSIMYGQVLTITNANASNTITFTDGATPKLKLDSPTRVLGSGGTLSLKYDNTVGLWSEVGFSSGQTSQGRRVVSTSGSSSTLTPTGDSADVYRFTTSATGTLTVAAPTGSAQDGQQLVLQVKTSGAADTFSWNSIYRGSTTVALPTTSSSNKWDYVGFQYNSSDSKWDLLALNQGF